MRKIQIVTIGKVKERWLAEGIDHYLERLRPMMETEFRLVRSDTELIDLAKGRNVFALDAAGEELESEFFAKKIFDAGARVTLIIGAAEGLPQEIKRSVPLLSLSKMTFTHQTVRLLALEQLYRACQIERGSGYVK